MEERNGTAAWLAIRIALAAAALLCAGWLAISLRNERLQVTGIRLLAEKPPRVSLALDDFRRASELSASQQPELFQASVYFLQGRRAMALSMLRGLLAKEPDNRTGWILLGNWLTASGQPGAAARAFGRARQLNGGALRP